MLVFLSVILSQSTVAERRSDGLVCEGFLDLGNHVVIPKHSELTSSSIVRGNAYLPKYGDEVTAGLIVKLIGLNKIAYDKGKSKVDGEKFWTAIFAGWKQGGSVMKYSSSVEKSKAVQFDFAMSVIFYYFQTCDAQPVASFSGRFGIGSEILNRSKSDSAFVYRHLRTPSQLISDPRIPKYLNYVMQLRFEDSNGTLKKDILKKIKSSTADVQDFFLYRAITSKFTPEDDIKAILSERDSVVNLFIKQFPNNAVANAFFAELLYRKNQKGEAVKFAKRALVLGAGGHYRRVNLQRIVDGTL